MSKREPEELDHIQADKQTELSLVCRSLIDELSSKLLEREELSAILLLTIFAGKNMLLIGKPGVAKTKILRLIMNAIVDARSFEYLMMYDTKPEAIFGTTYQAPNGEVVRNTKYSMLEADFVFLDEIFKGSSETINGLLGPTSEDKIYHGEGMDPLRLDMISFFAASNELHQGEILDAMNDRLLLRYNVKRIEKDENFHRMIEDDFDANETFETTIGIPDLLFVSREALRVVTLPKDISIIYGELKKKLISEENIEASDRRLKDAVKLLKVSAYLNQRVEIDESDVFILRHIIWNTFSEDKRIKEVIGRHIFKTVEYVEKLLQDATDEFNKLNAMKQAHLNDFLLKKTQVPVSEIDEYFQRHLGMVRGLMHKLNESYDKITAIEDLKKK